jgi:2-polyprenyl-3-methyl-5-hydroxy-6-metoxy-1,4-benzoquinol methylase
MIVHSMTENRDHWERVYRDKAETGVSWYQAIPHQSLAYIRAAAPGTDASIIDIGSGATTLIERLLDAGYRDITALDISDAAISRAKTRLGARAAAVAWIAADITAWTPPRTWDIWHDRAVFHFLTAPEAQARYRDALERATGPGSHVIMSTFALDGPERCSGLPVQRYSAQGLAQKLGPKFTLNAQSDEEHTTPSGGTQKFMYAMFSRV